MANNGKHSYSESQTSTILFMLREAREENCGVEIPKMMRAGISAFNGRIMDLRRRGFGIENNQWYDEQGRRHSQYRLTRDPDQDAQ